MSSSNGWLANLSQADLLSFIPSNVLDSIDDLDKAAGAVLADYTNGIDTRKRLATDDKEKKDMSFGQSSWLKLKREFYVLLCTDDDSYKEVRLKLSSSSSTVTVLLVALVAQALGDKLGLVCGPIVTLVAVLLYTALRLGRGVACRSLAAECGS